MGGTNPGTGNVRRGAPVQNPNHPPVPPSCFTIGVLTPVEIEIAAALKRRNWLKDVDRDAIMCEVREKLRAKGMLKELSELENKGEGSNVFGMKGLIEKFGRPGVEQGEQAWNPKNP